MKKIDWRPALLRWIWFKKRLPSLAFLLLLLSLLSDGLQVGEAVIHFIAWCYGG